MKKLLVIFLALSLLLPLVGATSEIAIPSSLTRPAIKPAPTSNHPLIPGESATTGLPISDAPYVPILVQIDNNMGAWPQWGISQADIMYELPIQGQGHTRLTALFSDQYPEEVGPVRSGRVMHADLREEWDAGFVFYGKQTAQGSDLREALKQYGVNQKGLAIDGIGNKYKDYFQRVRYHKGPHNVNISLANLRELLLSLNYSFQPRPFQFSDSLPTQGVKAHSITVMHKKNADTSSVFLYQEDQNRYVRYTPIGIYSDLHHPEEPILYSNVIIQRTRLTFNNSSLHPLLPDVVGQGAAEIFIGGKYIAGCWTRDNIKNRTIFYDENGQEISLQRGKTWIIITNEETDVFYDEHTIDINSFFSKRSRNRSASSSTQGSSPKKKENVQQQNKATQTSKQQSVPGQAIDMNDFRFQKAPRAAIIRYYTPIRLEGFEHTIYMFKDKSGTHQYRVYGRIIAGSRGFYPLEVTQNKGAGDAPFDIKIVASRPVKDAKVFALYQGVNLSDQDIPMGFTKKKGDGIYSFINVFGREEQVAYATCNGENPAWYQVNGRRPLAGSPEIDFSSIKHRISPEGTKLFQIPKELKRGYAIPLKVTLSDGQEAIVLTDKPPIPEEYLTK